ncbi:SDR family oxidoreductase [Alsobacter sp. SYSU M60028]|uniref:SDR family oxidoreductase n=1 Tax=Alsobacter ponti TaxID=2962936 RepID=A0ABT1L7W7_9HYPH|nr:SDR family NAD(P)-dependent oxidoreductase [Alsobacter ponti]MCP8937591.1 SDR family oxidoreductase [Alsobacter ponti]
MTHPWSFADLAGRRALVTGGSVGIGAAVARAMAACGTRVVVHYHRNFEAAAEVVDAIQAEGGEAWAESADLSRPGAATALVERAADRLGGLDILVNNAGDMIARVRASETPDDFYRTVMDLNLTSVFEACRAAAPLLKASGDGVIVSTSSIAARNGGGPGSGVYAAAKAAVSSLTRSLARELAPDGVRVNAVAPGFIMTSIHERLTDDTAIETARRSIPLGRIGAPEDCVGAYLWLASNRLSGYVTGQVIEVNGGLLSP